MGECYCYTLSKLYALLLLLTLQAGFSLYKYDS